MGSSLIQISQMDDQIAKIPRHISQDDGAQKDQFSISYFLRFHGNGPGSRNSSPAKITRSLFFNAPML